MKLFVTDYDDTLYTSESSIKNNIKKLKELQSNDYLVMIATGRSFSSIKKQIVERKIPYDYLSCADGSIIYDKNDKIIYADYMDTEIIKPFQEFYEKLNYEEIQFSYPEGYLNSLKDTEQILGINVCLDTRLYNKKIEKNFYKLEKKYPNYNYLAYSHPNYSYLCIKPSGISKSYSISVIQKKHNIAKDDIYVIGDSSNDIEMISDFNGVGMTKSCDEILKIVNVTYDEVSDYIDIIINNI